MRSSSTPICTLRLLRSRSTPRVTLLLLALTSACGDSPTEPKDIAIPWERLSGKIAYSVQRCNGGCTSELFVIDAAARGVHSLATSVYSGLTYQDLAWSPDASRIAYSMFPLFHPDPDATSAIMSIPASGGAPTQHLSILGRVAFPAWSRDARLGYWMSGWIDGVWHGPGLWIDGGSVHSGGASESRFTWAPDNRHIVAAIGDNTSQGALYLIDLENGSRTALLQSSGAWNSEIFSDPMYSPDGSRIAYKKWGGQPGGSDARSEIWTMAADGTDRRRLTSGTHHDSQPSWSPDGQQIAFLRDGRVFVINADGSGVVQITGVDIQRPLGADVVISVAWAP